MPRFGVKTYGRLGQKSSGTNEAFDDVLSGKEKAVTVPVSSWDKTTNTYSKSNQNGEENTSANKKRKTECRSGFGDPFTFESDEDSPRKKSVKKEQESMEPEVMGPPHTTPPQFMFSAKRMKTNIESAVSAKTENEKLGNCKTDEINSVTLYESEDSSVKRKDKPVSRTNKVAEDPEVNNSAEKLSRSSGQLPVSLFFKKVAQESKNNNKDNGKMNSSEKGKLKVYDKPRKFFTSKNRNNRAPQISRSKDHTYSQGMHKFTVSRRIKEDNEEQDIEIDITNNDSDESKSDHNYSYLSNTKRLTADHTYSSSTDKQKLDPFLNRATVSGEHAYGRLSNKLSNSTSDGQDSTEEEDSNNYLYDSDNELTSGDPEIIFNSPTKRAREAARLDPDDGHDTDSLPEDTSDHHGQKILNSQNTVISGSRMSSQGSKGMKTFSRKINSPTKSIDSPMSVSSQSGTESPAGKKERKYEIFRSRKSKHGNDIKKDPAIRRILTSPKKSPTKAQYNPRQWISRSSSDTGLEFDRQKDDVNSKSKPNTAEEENTKVTDGPTLKRTVTWPQKAGKEVVTTLKVSRQHKPLFTVVRNVKEAHECQEYGETQEFEDDIDYILDGIGDEQSVSVRCLSTSRLAEKCCEAAFRMHLRAHGTLAKVFTALHNAYKYPTLALCTSAVMYLMSRDRLNMDLETETLELIIHLLENNPDEASSQDNMAEYDRVKQRIESIFQDVVKAGAKHVDVKSITASNLAMETLLSLTSQRSGEWLKEELRKLGGLDNLVNSIVENCEGLHIYTQDLTEDVCDKLQAINRVLKVIENVSSMNPDNQDCLVSVRSAALITSTCSVLQMSEACLPLYPTPEDGVLEGESKHLINSILAVLRVLLNLTHDHEMGSSEIGRHPNMLKTALNFALHLPQYVPTNDRFDLQVLSLGLLINMMEHCEANRVRMVKTNVYGPHGSEWETDTMGALEALVQLFLLRYEAAKQIEAEEGDDNPEMKDSQNAFNFGEEEDPEQSGEWRESESCLEWMPKHKDSMMPPPKFPVTKDASKRDQQEKMETDENQEVKEADLTTALHKAGKHMEDSIVAAYVSLLLGCIIQSSTQFANSVREKLPEGNFDPMVAMLKKFLSFMNLTTASGNENTILGVIEILETC